MIPPELLPLRILLVDDDEINLEGLAALLGCHGFTNVGCIKDSKLVESSINVEPPDLLVLDLVMPEPDGFSILTQLRKSYPAGSYLPVLVVTGSDTPEDRKRVLEAGASDFLSKPYEASEVVLRVVNQLRVRWQHRQLEQKNATLDGDVQSKRHLYEDLGATTARLSALVENLQSGILLEDEKRKILQTNSEFFRLFGAPDLSTDIGGQDCSELVHAYSTLMVDPRAFVNRVEQLILEQQLVVGEEVHLVNGKILERDYVPIFEGGKTCGHLWAFRDVTQRKRMDQELEEARDAALESALQKSQFLANMSHEIRTPINGVFGMLDHLSQSSLDADQAHLLRTARASAETLLEIVDDVLDFSKIEAGKLEVRQSIFSPATLMEESLLVVAGSAYAKGVELIPYLDPTVPHLAEGDVLRIRQILTNFLSNAVKFTEKGEIVLRANLVQTHSRSGNKVGPHLLFEVQDTGTGIPEHTMSELFQPFVQGDNSPTRRHGGTGLGLAICRQLATIMGGEVGGESQPGIGSTFWFALPFSLAHGDGVIQSPPSFHGLKVLVVEDNASARLQLLKQLEVWSVAGAGAPHAKSALAQLRLAARAGRAYNLVLVDADLPGQQTADLLELLRLEKGLGDLEVVLLTSFAGSVAVQENQVYVRRLVKPVRPSQLLQIVSTCRVSGAHRNAVSLVGQAIPEMSLEEGIPLRILVVDDSPTNQEVLVRWLRKWGHDVLAVSSGREALDCAKNESLDLILMDCQMPNMDGYEATELIRSFPGIAGRVPIIAVTAHAMGYDKEKCLQAGMDDYLAKPVRPDLLMEALRKWRPESTPEAVACQSPSLAPDFTELGKNTPDALFDGHMILEMKETVGEADFQVLAGLFVQQGKLHAHALRELGEKQDLPALAKIAHTLKGMSLQFGATRITSACTELSRLCLAGDGPEVAPVLDILLKEMYLAGQELERTELPAQAV